MWTFSIGDDLSEIVVVDGLIVRGLHHKGPNWNFVLLGQLHVRVTSILIRVGVINYNALAFGQCSLSDFETLFFRLEGIPVDSDVSSLFFKFLDCKERLGRKEKEKKRKEI